MCEDEIDEMPENFLHLKDIIINVNRDSFICALCGNKRAKKKMKRHLREFHKVIENQVNNIVSLAKSTNRNKLSCNLCGKNITFLTKHLVDSHKMPRKEALSCMYDSRKNMIENAESNCQDFMMNLAVYSEYCNYSVGYKDDSNYTKSRLSNLERFGKIASETLGYDPNDLLTIPENDNEIEQACELLVTDYIAYIKKKSLSPNSAIVYLGDIKDLLTVMYRYRSRIPLKDFLLRQLANCKKARVGKLDSDKYEEDLDLVTSIEKHRECKYVLDIVNSIENNRIGTDLIVVRNFLISRILIENVQRPGVVYNMKLEEFEKSTTNISDQNVLKKSILVRRHKTAVHFGAAHIHIPMDIYKMIEQYIKWGRPVSDSTHVFLTANGNAMNNQTCWKAFSQHISECQIGINHVSANMWRRAANSMVQHIGDPKLKEASSRQLTHSIKEGETSYHNAVKSSRSARNHDMLKKNDIQYCEGMSDGGRGRSKAIGSSNKEESSYRIRQRAATKEDKKDFRSQSPET